MKRIKQLIYQLLHTYSIHVSLMPHSKYFAQFFLTQRILQINLKSHIHFKPYIYPKNYSALYSIDTLNSIHARLMHTCTQSYLTVWFVKYDK